MQRMMQRDQVQRRQQRQQARPLQYSAPPSQTVSVSFQLSDQAAQSLETDLLEYEAGLIGETLDAELVEHHDTGETVDDDMYDTVKDTVYCALPDEIVVGQSGNTARNVRQQAEQRLHNAYTSLRSNGTVPPNGRLDEVEVNYDGLDLDEQWTYTGEKNKEDLVTTVLQEGTGALEDYYNELEAFVKASVRYEFADTDPVPKAYWAAQHTAEIGAEEYDIEIPDDHMAADDPADDPAFH